MINLGEKSKKLRKKAPKITNLINAQDLIIDRVDFDPKTISAHWGLLDSDVEYFTYFVYKNTYFSS